MADARGSVDEQVQNAVAVLPAYARGVAAELRDAAEQRSAYAEPPHDSDAVPGPRQAAASRATPPSIDANAAAAILCKALRVRASLPPPLSVCVCVCVCLGDCPPRLSSVHCAACVCMCVSDREIDRGRGRERERERW